MATFCPSLCISGASSLKLVLRASALVGGIWFGNATFYRLRDEKKQYILGKYHKYQATIDQQSSKITALEQKVWALENPAEYQAQLDAKAAAAGSDSTEGLSSAQRLKHWLNKHSNH
eukprot:CAMPEP_0184350470 /NCGR_PEP_ID=MMETSP1089-20130417/37916_1 /TAXON_ID=38269 ORGANISM="Gloeochaete wittrockiana, Strain SAG46.84" /NCGR_SAMPLE_ID=MMETSP1089 /ASSEMBLY_ACC=CAM_ASM_000445 /LENGTH=116 /DNA_ID=CAMNT_0026683213 /DNA_START=17 /DNA_END=367 /DNA_ORIENTATION=+